MNIIFLGPPGIGKGTHAEIVSKKHGIPRISTGEILREEIKKRTDLGKEAKTYMDTGGLVPDELVIDIFRERIGREDCRKGFILDGFPRTVTQAEELERITHIDFVLNLVAPHRVIIERITGRLTCRKCGAIYHAKNIRPKSEGVCDTCGGELYQREDQKEEAVEKRLELYEKRTKPLIEYYQRKGILKDVNVEGGKGEVSERIGREINDFIKSMGI
ncbi:MAG: adenylate kinase [Candidatus Aenigmarchaeota archaeon]|nr:adenylate kinase [Candidatus Aenigmarchaeota archaeon]NIP40993.1 adenylate kinase [Candidatus Aenigmarchaeota archaeon]NIQ17352.1 adenylate kinase [Candidatus Aenigmarchaeota archaeon]NIS73314.1 adenylate kinase [Candidatus Aenigmarchaeota archaeon]